MVSLKLPDRPLDVRVSSIVVRKSTDFAGVFTGRLFTMPGREVLLFSEDGLGELDDLRVLHRVSRRVAVVEVPSARIAELAARPDIQIIDTKKPLELPDQMEPSEALFAQAWKQRHRSGDQKVRRGDRQNWGAPGYEPPDKSASNGR